MLLLWKNNKYYIWNGGTYDPGTGRIGKHGRQDAENGANCNKAAVCMYIYIYIYITYSECVFVALGIWRAERMRRVIVSRGACSAVVYVLRYRVTITTFGKKVVEHKMCFYLSI